jgi:hypothetical protein
MKIKRKSKLLFIIRNSEMKLKAAAHTNKSKSQKYKSKGNGSKQLNTEEVRKRKLTKKPAKPANGSLCFKGG